jgi:hypothetical protein
LKHAVRIEGFDLRRRRRGEQLKPEATIQSVTIASNVLPSSASGFDCSQLNPAEQVWQQLRDRSLANRCHGSYDDITDACCEAWNKFTQIPNAIRSLCTRNWANLAPVHRIS